MIIGKDYTTPSKCPKCNKDEDVIEICKNCGHQYDQSGPGWLFLLLAFISIVASLLVLFWIIDFLGSCNINWRECSVSEQLAETFKFFKKISW